MNRLKQAVDVSSDTSSRWTVLTVKATNKDIQFNDGRLTNVSHLQVHRTCIVHTDLLEDHPRGHTLERKLSHDLHSRSCSALPAHNAGACDVTNRLALSNDAKIPTREELVSVAPALSKQTPFVGRRSRLRKSKLVQ